jgi:hypothetical protein
MYVFFPSHTTSLSFSKGASLLWLWTAVHFVLLFKFVELAAVCVLGSLFGGQRAAKVRWPVLFSSCLNFYGMVRCPWFYMYRSLIKTLHGSSSIIGGSLCACRLSPCLSLFRACPTNSNYINDASPHQSYHILLPTQLFFDITDVIPGVALYFLLQRSADVPPAWLLSTSLIVSAAHLFLSVWDQGFIHLVTLKGSVLRDAMFVVSDLAGLAAVGWYIRDRVKRGGRVLGVGVGVLLVSYFMLKRVAGYL